MNHICSLLIRVLQLVRKPFFYNPPIIHKTFGVRRSAVLEVSDLAKRLYTAGIQSIIFAKSRVRVEMIVTYLKELTRNKLLDESVRGYRGVSTI